MGVAKLVPVVGCAVTRRTTWAGVVVVGTTELSGATGLTGVCIMTTRVTLASFSAGMGLTEEKGVVEVGTLGVSGGLLGS